MNETTTRYQFAAELLNRYRDSWTLTLDGPTELVATLRVSNFNNLRKVIHIGGETFRISEIKFDGEADLIIRAIPNDVTEYRYVTLSTGQVQLHFSLKNSASEGRTFTFQSALDWTLDQVDLKTGLTNRQLIDAVIAKQRKSQAATELGTHEDFGSW